MSKKPILREKSTHKLKKGYHQGSFSQLPPLSELSQSQFIHTHPSYSMAKLLVSKKTKPEPNTEQKSEINTSTKQKFRKIETIESTQASDEGLRDINILEAKLNSTANIENIKHKYQVAQEVWSGLVAINSPISNILANIQGIVGKWVEFLERKAEQSDITLRELDENKLTLKILKKRFKKMAAEILQGNEEIIKREQKYGELKERYYKLTRNHKINMEEREKIVANLSAEIQKLHLEFGNIREKASNYKSKAKYLSELLNRIKKEAKPQWSEIFENFIDKSLIVSDISETANDSLLGLDSDSRTIANHSKYTKQPTRFSASEDLNISI